MALTRDDIERIALEAGKAAHDAITGRLDDLKRMMREEAAQLDQRHAANCPVKEDIKRLDGEVKTVRLSMRKMVALIVVASIGGGGVSRLPDVLAALKTMMNM